MCQSIQFQESEENVEVSLCVCVSLKSAEGRCATVAGRERASHVQCQRQYQQWTRARYVRVRHCVDRDDGRVRVAVVDVVVVVPSNTTSDRPDAAAAAAPRRKTPFIFI